MVGFSAHQGGDFGVIVKTKLKGGEEVGKSVIGGLRIGPEAEGQTEDEKIKRRQYV